MKTLLICMLIVSGLVGCATNYKEYSAALQTIETAKHNAEGERWKAMAQIAQSGDATVKVAAMMAMQQGGAVQQTGTNLRAPEAPGESALRWLSLILPTAVQAYGINANTRMGIHQSDNAMALGINQSNNATAQSTATNAAFIGIASKGFDAANGIAGRIQSPAANVTTTTNTATTLSGSGVIGNGTYSTADRHDTTTTTDRHDVTTTDRHDVTDNHTTNPATTVQIPPGKTCTVDAKGVLACL